MVLQIIMALPEQSVFWGPGGGGDLPVAPDSDIYWLMGREMVGPAPLLVAPITPLPALDVLRVSLWMPSNPAASLEPCDDSLVIYHLVRAGKLTTPEEPPPLHPGEFTC